MDVAEDAFEDGLGGGGGLVGRGAASELVEFVEDDEILCGDGECGRYGSRGDDRVKLREQDDGAHDVLLRLGLVTRRAIRLGDVRVRVYVARGKFVRNQTNNSLLKAGCGDPGRAAAGRDLEVPCFCFCRQSDGSCVWSEREGLN